MNRRKCFIMTHSAQSRENESNRTWINERKALSSSGAMDEKPRDGTVEKTKLKTTTAETSPCRHRRIRATQKNAFISNLLLSRLGHDSVLIHARNRGRFESRISIIEASLHSWHETPTTTVIQIWYYQQRHFGVITRAISLLAVATSSALWSGASSRSA